MLTAGSSTNRRKEIQHIVRLERGINAMLHIGYVVAVHKDMYVRVDLAGIIHPMRAKHRASIYYGIYCLFYSCTGGQRQIQRFYPSEQSERGVQVELHIVII